MLGFVSSRRLLTALSMVVLVPLLAGAQDGEGRVAAHPPTTHEAFHYIVEWRLIDAGTATLKVMPSGTADYPSVHSELILESTGLVSKLYKVEDKYFGNYEPDFCAISAQMSASEGRRRRESSVNYDRTRNKAVYLERDLVKNTIVHNGEIDVPPCVHDVVGALLALRHMNIEPGKAAEIPISDGKKSAKVRVEAQEREQVKINDQVYQTIRYEAFLFNNVIYSRKARLQLWVTDDARRLPVQIRVRMNFPIGTVTLSLDKVERI